MHFLKFQDSYVLVSSQLDQVVAGIKLDFFLGIIRSADLRRHHKASSAPTREQRLRTRALRQRQGGWEAFCHHCTVAALWWLPGGTLSLIWWLPATTLLSSCGGGDLVTVRAVAWRVARWQLWGCLPLSLTSEQFQN